jgi:glycine hydroxymethyltransferase
MNNNQFAFAKLIQEISVKQPLNLELISYIANLGLVHGVIPEVARLIVNELADQRLNIKMIASENYCSIATQATMANLLTDKYAEGYPGHRFYAGCDNIDELENIAAFEAKELFNCEHAYTQPHSGADANLIAFWAVLHAKVAPKVLERLGQEKLGDLTPEQWEVLRREIGSQRLLALDYYSGGHLTHGYRFNVSAQMFEPFSYAVAKDTGLLDYDQIEKTALDVKPLILLAGYSAYPRKVNFARMREIADKVGAVFMVDMAHFAGLVAGKVFEGDFNPIPHAHIVTSTTHKTLRGPRGGIVLCVKELAEYVDKGCPHVIGGPLPHVIAAKAISFREARSPQFIDYAHKIVENAQTLAEECLKLNVPVATNGTDNHLILVDVRKFGLNGRQAEEAVRSIGITLNRNSLPYDPNGPWFTSGLRIGTPAITTLGMGKSEIAEIAKVLALILENTKPAVLAKSGTASKTKVVIDEAVQQQAKARVTELLNRYPVYPELDLQVLQKCVGL